MRIYLDMDGVITDYDALVLETYRRRTGMDPDQAPLMRQHGKKLANKYWDDVTALMEEGFKIPLLPWAHELWTHCKHLSDSVYFLTSHGGSAMFAARKVELAQEHFNTENIVITRHKHLLASADSLLVDDREKLTKSFEAAGGRVFLWPNQYDLHESRALLNSTLAAIGEIVHG